MTDKTEIQILKLERSRLQGDVRRWRARVEWLLKYRPEVEDYNERGILLRLTIGRQPVTTSSQNTIEAVDEMMSLTRRLR